MAYEASGQYGCQEFFCYAILFHIMFLSFLKIDSKREGAG